MTSNFINKNVQYLLISLLIYGLTACQPSTQLDNDLQDYQQRMATVLKHDAPDFIVSYLPAYPALRELDNALADSRIKLSEFYQLQHCQLATIVAQRNTVLGKLQAPSSRFIYEKNMIQSLRECISQTQQAELKVKLNNWLQIKQQNLPLVWADMLQKSTEMPKTLSSNQGLIVGTAQDGLSETLAALHFLVLSEKQDRVGQSELEQHLYNLAKFSLPAKLWRSQNLLTLNIHSTTLWLKQHGAMEFCHAKQQSKPGQTAQYLRNVFQLFYIEKIQPIATQINHYHYKLAPAFELLLNHPVLSKSFKHYLAQQHLQNFSDYQRAMKQHIDLWQLIFKQCHMSPGSSKTMKS